MDNYHIVHQDKAWEIRGENKKRTFETKQLAIDEAKKIAQSQDRSVIIHTRDGRVSSVISNGGKFAKGKRIQTARVKRRFKASRVRKAIAQAMYERGG